MASLEIRDLSKRFGEREVVKSVSFSVADGEIVALLGPSGSGKTTLLRCIAGLERPDSGEVLISGKRVNDVAPRERDVSMVFQNYALFPLMTVRENIAFPLRVRGVEQTEVEARVKATAEKLGIVSLLDRSPAKLSGGEQQRVAIARAVIRPTNAFLMDEPLSNLDAPLRAQLRTELKVLQRDLNMTVVYVTHDQVEAMTLADKIGLLNDGRLLQFGTPLDLYRHPLSPFAARFVGSPGANLLELVADGEGLAGQGFKVGVPKEYFIFVSQSQGRRLVLSVRPEDISAARTRGADGFDGTVRLVEPLGASTMLEINVGGSLVKALVPPDSDFREGEEVRCGVDFSRTRLFDAETGEPLSWGTQQE